MSEEQKKKILIDFTIRHAWHRISRMYNQKAQIHGITMSCGFIMMMVKKEGTPSTKLGPMMGMEPTSLSRTLKLMEDEGFIHRKESEKDKRQVLIFLTEKGIDKRRIIRSSLLSFNEELERKISQKDLQGFHKVMNALDTLMEEIEKEQK
ncbi:MAG: MarR family transcriptional regulator [Bacteroidetes bacterium]|nr:MarR family transcriptional regulator [Bacteroidota bacterium]